MCGIVGLINFDRERIDPKVLDKMTDALIHRGPDDRGTFIDQFVGLGHRRLSIIDLSDKAHQPMLSDDGQAVLIYNGEIYNFREIKKNFGKQRVRFRSHSDTEVLLQVLAREGVASLNSFNGMFAFALWDREHKVLTLSRDRYGIKPLYYWQNDKVFMFASEIKAFLQHPLFKVAVDQEALLEYFTFQNTFTCRTLFEGVKLLPPGHFLQIDLRKKAKITIEQYWDFQFKDGTVKSEKDSLEECDRLFKQAVKRQLVSDVEVGSYLSGGIDSGSIVAIASQYIKELKTFCIGFDLSSASGMELTFDERLKAERISCRYQTEHYEMVLKSGDMMRCLPHLVWTLEDLRLGQSYPNFYAAKLASRFTKVCLSGGGGDELFAGYPWRYYTVAKKERFSEYVSEYYKYWQRLIPNSIIWKLFAPIKNHVKDVWTEDIFKEVLSHHPLNAHTPRDYINHSLYFEAKTFLQGLLMVDDKLSMAYGLELRVPFLDNDFVNFAMKLPVEYKLKNIKNIIQIDEDEVGKRQQYSLKTNDGKIILRKVLGKYIGPEIANLNKQGFSGPDASWFKGESIDYVKSLLCNKKALIYNYFDYPTACTLINEHISGVYNRRLFIWSLLCFEWWLRIFLKDQAMPEINFYKNKK